MRFGNAVHHIKDNLFEPPPLFKEIQKISGTTDQEMFQVYNMGHRFEAYCKTDAVDSLISIAKSFGIEAQEIGRTEPSKLPEKKNHLDITLAGTTLAYS
jgi:phosphoribosylformylglycinamidine cyclo-ligase